jgi:nucleoid-associated protein YgaU
MDGPGVIEDGVSGPTAMKVLTGLCCDRCGMAAERYSYCAGCSRFVCAACWEPEHEACLTCTRPGLPVAGRLGDSIRTTLGSATHPHQSAPTTRVSRALAQTAQRAPEEENAPQPSPPPSTAAPPRTERGLLRVAVAGVTLGTALILLPSIVRFGDRPDAPSSLAPEIARSTPTLQPATTTPVRTYVVRAGDTLRSIARQIYGDENAWRRIYEANRSEIANPDSLVIGSELRIPAT